MTLKPANGSTSSIVLGVTLTCLVACGGNGGADTVGNHQLAGYAYVASVAAPDAQAPGMVFQYSIDSSGALTALSPASVPAGSNPAAMISDPTGRYVYILNQGNASISQYSVGAGGVLSKLNPATVSVGVAFPSGAGNFLSIHPNSHSLYVVISPRDPQVAPTTSIVQYAMGDDGRLSPLNPGVINVAITAGGPLALDPSGVYAYLAGEAVAADGEVRQFSVAGSGELTAIAPPTFTAARNPVGVVTSPRGQTAYVLSACIDNICDGQIAEYAVGENGVLTPTGAVVPTASHVIPISLLTDSSESDAYLLTNLMGVDTNAGALYQYAISGTGALVPDSPPSVNVSSGAVAQTLLGPNLYALSSNAVGAASSGSSGGYIDHYSIGTRGFLTTASTITVAAGYPIAMTVVATR